MQLIISQAMLMYAVNLIFKAADKRNSLAILANLKLVLSPERLTLLASDLEVELQAEVALPAGACQQAGQITVPANKFKEIIKLLPEDAQVSIDVTDNKQCQIVFADSQFRLNTLPAEDFPLIGVPEAATSVVLSRETLLDLLDKTHFAMAIQDARYYLTGMLVELKDGALTAVATDGHRLALARAANMQTSAETLSAILPRKAVLELQRLLGEMRRSSPNVDNAITLNIGREFVQVMLPFGQSEEAADNTRAPVVVTFTARLIDGKFPDYRRVIPTNTDKVARFGQEALANILRRVSVLSNEKLRGVVFEFGDSERVRIRTSNAEHDEASAVLPIRYQGAPMEISFNVAYLLDVLNVLQSDIDMHMQQANGSVLIRQVNDSQHDYVIMPMRI
ncbi:DNA polymerase III subunit beta [Moraxella atlantae]|uniref:Beta sliding clamp n=1 Tax=Faucicola atlantae TaxID=34059 RepID=A0A378Q072_9GAMM|nr:DNA polymerase III subunit beta [Moraxella atlantae]OPH34371.1 DNA polymerase III subunit beta [Moraxella atlantae]STY94253.1 DNA polymerase III subunit beta [Moraxella atlantae]